MKSFLVVLVIVGIVILSIVFSGAKTGAVSASRFCPGGGNPVFEGVPGGGLQMMNCVPGQPISARGNTFDTYTAHPQGDVRRQKIAQRGAF